jgi:hypothetical protein
MYCSNGCDCNNGSDVDVYVDDSNAYKYVKLTGADVNDDVAKIMMKQL